MRKPKVWPVLAVLWLALGAGCRASSAPATPPGPAPAGVATTQPAGDLSATSTAAPTPTVIAPTTASGQLPLIALDPGHGGEDLGARHFNLQHEMDIHESTIVLDLAHRVGDKLKAHGYRVFYTHDTDVLPNPGYAIDLNGDGEPSPLDDLLMRNKLINESGADLLLSLHLNAWENRDEALVRATGGTETYYCPDRPFGDDNLRFATLVHENILAAIKGLGLQANDRNVRIDNNEPGDMGRHLVILGPQNDIIKIATNMPGALSEPMFITCDAEAAALQRPEVLDALADAYVKAIVTFFEEKGKP